MPKRKRKTTKKSELSEEEEVQPEEELKTSLVKKIIEHPKSLKITIYSIIVIIFVIVIWWIIRAVDSQYEYYKWQDKKTENRK